MPSGPRDGDTVLYCGHAERQGQHFFKVNEVKFRPPNSEEELVAQWVIQCDECFATLPKKPELDDFVIAGHDTWVGDDPIIKNPSYESN